MSCNHAVLSNPCPKSLAFTVAHHPAEQHYHDPIDVPVAESLQISFVPWIICIAAMSDPAQATPAPLYGCGKLDDSAVLVNMLAQHLIVEATLDANRKAERTHPLGHGQCQTSVQSASRNDLRGHGRPLLLARCSNDTNSVRNKKAQSPAFAHRCSVVMEVRWETTARMGTRPRCGVMEKPDQTFDNTGRETDKN